MQNINKIQIHKKYYVYVYLYITHYRTEYNVQIIVYSNQMLCDETSVKSTSSLVQCLL